MFGGVMDTENTQEQHLQALRAYKWPENKTNNPRHAPTFEEASHYLEETFPRLKERQSSSVFLQRLANEGKITLMRGQDEVYGIKIDKEHIRQVDFAHLVSRLAAGDQEYWKYDIVDVAMSRGMAGAAITRLSNERELAGARTGRNT